MKKVLIILLAITIILVVGCRSLLDEVTPATIPPRSVDYIGPDNPVADVGQVPSLGDAQRIKDEIIIKHRDTQIDLLRVAQDDKFKYQDALGFIEVAIAESQQLQDLIVGSEDNPYSLLGVFASLGAGTLIGRQFLKRPGDYTPQEVGVLTASMPKTDGEDSEG